MSDPWANWNLDDPEVIVDALVAHPLAAAWLASRPNLPATFVPFLQRRAAPPDELFATLDPTGLQLLQLASFHRGVDRAMALADAEGCPPDVIDRSARNLVVAGFATCTAGILEVAEEVAPLISLPLPLLEDHLFGITSDRLGRACRLFGVDGGTHKADRAETLRSLLRDPEEVAQAIADAGPRTREIFDHILARTTGAEPTTDGYRDVEDIPGAIAIHDILTPEERNRAYYRSSYGGRSGGSRTSIEELTDRLIVGSDSYGPYRVWLWMDVAYGLTGRVFARWPVPPEHEAVPIEDTQAQAPRATESTRLLAGHLGAHPVEGKKTGDRRPAVRSWRAAAKAHQIEPATATMLGELAADLGLVYAKLLPSTGRGRNATQPVQWQANPRRLADFEARTTGEQWLLLASAWLTSDGFGADLTLSTKRRLLVAMLASLPEGMGWTRSDLGTVAAQRHIAGIAPETLDQILAELVTLGMVPGSGPIGLTRVGRAAAGGSAAVEQVVTEGSAAFVVQPDHSVIAPGDLSPAIASALHRYADLESEGGANVWRLSAQRLSARATTETATEVTEFFCAYSSVALPDVVVRFISDAMASTTPIAVLPAGCVINADDPMVVTDAARHKAAKLTVLAPGVAASPLSSAKVTEVLLSKGVVLQGTGSMAATSPKAAPARIADEASWLVSQPDPNAALGAARPLPLACPSAAAIGDQLRERASGKKRGKGGKKK